MSRAYKRFGGMSMWQKRGGWVAWLGRLRPERAVCAFATDLDAALEEIETFALSTSPQTIVVQLEWDQLPRLSDELEGVAGALAEAVFLRWPALYDAPFQTVDAIQPDEIVDAARKIPLVSLGAAQRVIDTCLCAELPLLRQYPLADRVHQLALALAPERLLIVLTTRSTTVGRDRAVAFSRGAEWIADKTKVRVVALLPTELSGTQDFDHISYGAFHDASALEWKALVDSAPTDTPVPPIARPALSSMLEPSTARAKGPDDIRVAFGVIIGQPHPGSEAEKLLHARITADEELRWLFQYNRIVVTSSGSSPCVDLVWHEGRLVVEIDGEDHRTLGSFIGDRKRDYELLLDGYRVLRLTSHDVLGDCDLVLHKLRKLSQAINKREAVS